MQAPRASTLERPWTLTWKPVEKTTRAPRIQHPAQVLLYKMLAYLAPTSTPPSNSPIQRKIHGAFQAKPLRFSKALMQFPYVPWGSYGLIFCTY